MLYTMYQKTSLCISASNSCSSTVFLGRLTECIASGSPIQWSSSREAILSEPSLRLSSEEPLELPPLRLDKTWRRKLGEVRGEFWALEWQDVLKCFRANILFAYDMELTRGLGDTSSSSSSSCMWYNDPEPVSKRKSSNSLDRRRLFPAAYFRPRKIKVWSQCLW